MTPIGTVRWTSWRRGLPKRAADSRADSGRAVEAPSAGVGEVRTAVGEVRAGDGGVGAGDGGVGAGSEALVPAGTWTGRGG